MTTKSIKFNEQDFVQDVIDSDQVVLVDFWAEWCAPCRVLGPSIDELADDFGDRAKVGKLNIDDNAQAAKDFGVSSIPTVLVFKNGKVVETLNEGMDLQTLTKKLKLLLKSS